MTTAIQTDFRFHSGPYLQYTDKKEIIMQNSKNTHRNSKSARAVNIAREFSNAGFQIHECILETGKIRIIMVGANVHDTGIEIDDELNLLERNVLGDSTCG